MRHGSFGTSPSIHVASTRTIIANASRANSARCSGRQLAGGPLMLRHPLATELLCHWSLLLTYHSAPPSPVSPFSLRPALIAPHTPAPRIDHRRASSAAAVATGAGTPSTANRCYYYELAHPQPLRHDYRQVTSYPRRREYAADRRNYSSDSPG